MSARFGGMLGARRSVAALAVSVLWLTAANVQAQVTAVAGGSPGYIALTIPVTASIASRCSFASNAPPNGAYGNADIHGGFTHSFSFALQCNGPARVAVQSVNGGLLATYGNVPSGYTNLAPYQVTLVLVGDPGVSMVSATCSALTLGPSATSPCCFRGPASGTQGLELGGTAGNSPGSYLQVSAPPYSDPAIPLASSAYSDTLTVTVSPAS